ncbi:MAG: glycosyltransferase [Pyrinomonadaceae bacterium]
MENLFNHQAKSSICVVKGNGPVETFIRAHVVGLPANVTLIHDFPPKIGDQPILSQSLVSRAQRKAGRQLLRREWSWEITSAYIKAFRASRADAVLAEFGQTGVVALEACRRTNLPLIVHFHGADISKKAVLEMFGDAYRVLLQEARAIVAVSRKMEEKLLSLGAPPEKLHYNPYGVDCDAFSGGGERLTTEPPVFLAVGRFVDKKAPQLTLLAFAEVYRAHPEARLRMIGDGPLLDACRDLAEGLGLAPAVSFLGVQPHAAIQEEMRGARAFVQHSVEALSGDCEGTPVAIPRRAPADCLLSPRATRASLMSSRMDKPGC